MTADRNWRENPEIIAIRDFCKRFGQDAALLLSFSGGQYRLTSYGSNGRLCKAARHLADRIGEIRRRDPALVREVVRRCLAVKGRIVSADRKSVV
jgi:hypothetical protein